MAYAPAKRRRRGMGDVLPPCSSVDVPAGFVGPINCDPSAGPVSYPASQSQVADVWAALQNIGTPAAASTPVPWGTIAMVGGGVFVVLLLLGRR